ncbi:hypothetical protein ACSBR1_004183 [Camellia fascicularis]
MNFLTQCFTNFFLSNSNINPFVCIGIVVVICVFQLFADLEERGLERERERVWRAAAAAAAATAHRFIQRHPGSCPITCVRPIHH